MDKFLASSEILENVTTEYEESAVYPELRSLDIFDGGHEPIGLRRHEMIAEIRFDTREARHRIVLPKMFELLR